MYVGLEEAELWIDGSRDMDEWDRDFSKDNLCPFVTRVKLSISHSLTKLYNFIYLNTEQQSSVGNLSFI